MKYVAEGVLRAVSRIRFSHNAHIFIPPCILGLKEANKATGCRHIEHSTAGAAEPIYSTPNPLWNKDLLHVFPNTEGEGSLCRCCSVVSQWTDFTLGPGRNLMHSYRTCKNKTKQKCLRIHPLPSHCSVQRRLEELGSFICPALLAGEGCVLTGGCILTGDMSFPRKWE